jgi:hypothetical protein
MTTLSPIFNAHTRPELPTGAESWEYLVVSLQEADGLKAGDPYSPESLNELGAQGWEAVGLLSLKQGDLIASPVALLKRPLT